MGEPAMGKIVISENITLDGVIQDPTGDDGSERGGWFNALSGPNREAWAKVELAEAQGAEALLMGRRSYQYFVARGWPSLPGDWADRLRSLPKYVVSSTLEAPDWANSSVLRGDVVTEVSKLKESVDGDIVVYASGGLVPTLWENELVDELRLIVFPAVLGTGEGLFGKTSGPKSLRLADSRPVGDGLVLLTYRTAV
jgi:dihydrofolate reductase